MAATIAEVVLYNEDSASPLTVSKPAAFASGEILVAVINQHGGDGTEMTAPSGWTQKGSTWVQGSSPNSVSGKVFSHVYNAGDPASWDFPYHSSADMCLILFRIQGADTTPNIAVTSTTFASSSSSMDSPSVTPNGSDDLLICILELFGNATALVETDPSGMTDRSQTQVAGNFLAEAAASEQLASSSPTGVRTWTSITPTGQLSATASIAIQSAATATAPGEARPAIPNWLLVRLARSQNPQVATYNSDSGNIFPTAPIVVSPPPAFVPPAEFIFVRSSLQDFATPVTPQPIVVSRPVPVSAGSQPVFARSSLQDFGTPVTPNPIVVGKNVPVPAASQPIFSRSSLADAVVAGASTPQPIVVSVPTFNPLTPFVFLDRNTLQDDPVLTTAPPIVVSKSPTPGAPVALLARTPAPDFATPVTPMPIVVSKSPTPGAPVALLARSPLPDPVLTTPNAIVVSKSPTPGVALSITARSSLEDVVAVVGSAPQPVVVTRQLPSSAVPFAFLDRNTLQDDPVLTTPQPIVVSRPIPGSPAAFVTPTRSSIQDFATPVTPMPMVVSLPTYRGAPGFSLVLRNTKADPPVLTTPGALVIYNPIRPGPPFVVFRRSSTEDAPTIFNATSDDLVTAGRTSAVSVTPAGTSAVTVVPGGTSTSTITPAGTSVPTTTSRGSSTPTVSDG